MMATKLDRTFAWALVVLLTAASTLYELWGHSLVTGQSGHWAFDDLRVLTESSVVVWNGHGIQNLYAGTDGLLVAFPGFMYALGLLTGFAHLIGLGSPGVGTYFGTSYNGYYLIGASWYLVLPVVAFAASLPLLAVDTLAALVSTPRSRRVLCVGLATIPLFWMSVLWGHPDDSVAVGLLLWAITSTIEKRWSRAAWLLGIGLCVQPLIGLAIPVLLSLFPLRKALGALWRIVLPVAVVLLPQLLGDPRETIRQVVVQPAMTPYKTPWFQWAPHVSAGKFAVPGSFMVSGGLIRSLSVLAALSLGAVLFMRRRRSCELNPAGVVWFCGLALSFRLLAEAVLLPYYIAPILIVLLVASLTSGLRFVATALTGLAATVTISTLLPPCVYWVCVSFTLVLVLVASLPRPLGSKKSPQIEGDKTDDYTMAVDDQSPELTG